jgi:hypothetical protein
VSYTYVEMEVSAATFEEVAAKLRDAGYDHAFNDGALDMRGIALRAAVSALEERPSRRRNPAATSACKGPGDFPGISGENRREATSTCCAPTPTVTF